MRKSLFLAMAFLFSLVRPGLPAEVVNFKSTADHSLTLEGKLTKPSGVGPFPALVLLHGCGGISRQRDDVWAKRLADWGYAALQVDSFGPRRESNICASRALLNDFVPLRVGDAYAAKSFLAGLPMVDPDRIAIMGWSHGGSSTLAAISPRTWGRAQKPDSPFRAAIAFYPYCGERLDRSESPLLIL
jgi:dienelactone hydrolase